LTITNASITLTVTVHFQIYQVVTSSSSGGFSCLELFDWIDVLTPGQRYIIDPANIRRAAGGSLVGQATNGRFMMTASAIFVGAVPTGFADLRLISYNYLTGQNWMSDTVRGITRMNNAIVRMAVDANGGPAPTGVLLLGSAGSAIAGTTGCPGVFSCVTGIGPTYLQMFRPLLLIVNSFFRTANPNAVQQGVPFGNRMTVFSVTDQYFGTDPFFRFLPASVTLTGFVFDDAENPFSITPRFATCVNEWTLAPDTAGATGNFADFIGASLTSAVANTGGWLRLTVSPLTAANQNVFGLFSQGLSFTSGSTTLGFGGGDLLIGVGRQGQSGVAVTTSLSGVIVSGTNVGTTF
jgi:hypothetical protein